ncbi:hypothetical protein B0H10DRAFT_1837161 [Mycena sp. CBHHK59/15]|nr:hypothetical protein B0H10DRAFT_1837161 [Mycena sp. CBHHK59/15]
MRRRYAEQHSRIQFNESDPFIVDRGLDQGDAHSVFTYLLYNSDLVEIVNEEGEAMVVYIDDDTMVMVGDDFKQTHSKLNDMMDCDEGADDCADNHNTIFGPAKFQLLDAACTRVPHTFMLCKQVPILHFNLKLSNHTIRSRESVKLLGIHIDRELWWHQQEAAVLAKGHEWLGHFASLSQMSGGMKVRQMWQLYLSICVPRMLYGTGSFLSVLSTNHMLGIKQCKRGIIKNLGTVQ